MRANYVFATPAERDKYLKKHYHDKAPEEFFSSPISTRCRASTSPPSCNGSTCTWMLYDILLKADRMSMANSLELRVPLFLDREMLELALSIPSRYRAGKTETKIALRAALGAAARKRGKAQKLGFRSP